MPDPVNKHRPGEENLRPWTKGQSGNPAGRPKRVKSIADAVARFGKLEAPEAIRQKMAKHFGVHVDKVTVWDAWILRIWVAALDGDSWATQFIAERTEGKVREGLDIALASGELPIRGIEFLRPENDGGSDEPLDKG